jgi:hypothetical protein
VGTDRALTFRISWVRPWLLAVTLMTAALLLIAGLGAAAGQGGAWVACALGLAVCSVVALVPITIGVATLQWHVGADGVGGRDNWHVYGTPGRPVVLPPGKANRKASRRGCG